MENEGNKFFSDNVPEWVKRRFNFLKSANPGREFNWSYFILLNKRAVEAVQQDLSGLGMIPAYTLNRRTQLIKNKNGSVVLFDCLNAATVRMLYYHLTIGAAQEHILDFLKEYISSCLLSIGDDSSALALLDEKIPFFFFNTLPKPPEFYTMIAKVNHVHLPKIPYEEAFPLIDLYKSCHELCHFLIHREPTFSPQLQQYAILLIDKILIEFYPEQLSKNYFEEMTKKGLSINETTKVKRSISDTYKNERLIIAKHRESLIEEIICDIYAFRAVFSWRLNAQQNNKLPALQPSDIFATLLLISRLIQQLEFFKEAAEMMKLGVNSWKQKESSILLSFRSIVVRQIAFDLINQVAQYSRELRFINFSSKEKRIVFKEISQRLYGIDMFLEMFMTIPISKALFYTVKSMQAKLKSKIIRDLYSDTANLLTDQQKIHYTLPVIEEFVLKDYFM